MYTDPATNQTSRVFDSLLEYPNLFTVKAVGRGANFAQNMVDLCNSVSNDAVKAHRVRASAGGKYESVSVDVVVQSGDMVYELYEKLGAHPDVVFKF
jgi:putative lipoic acid-binding regulatory protein